MKRFLIRLVALLIVLVAILFLTRNLIARKSVEVGFTRYTGFPMTVGVVSVAPTFGHIEVKELHLRNPPEFQEETFVNMPAFTIDYQLASLVTGAPHVNKMLIDISQLNVVKKSDGESNIQKLKGVAGGGSTDASTAKASRKYQIDKVKIHIGTVTVIDKQRGSTRTVPLNITATYENINEATDITRLVLVTMMSKVSLPDIGVNMGDLTKNLQGVSGIATEILKGAPEKIQSSGKGLLDTIRKKLPAQQ